MTEFQFERNELLTNLTLLEDHAEKFPCPFCIEKHLSKIVGYAEEIKLGGEQEKLMQEIATRAREMRRRLQGAEEHTHSHNPAPRKYEPYGLTAQEKRDKARVKGICKPRSRNRFCRLVRCIKKTEPRERAGEITSAVAVCRSSIYGSAK